METKIAAYTLLLKYTPIEGVPPLIREGRGIKPIINELKCEDKSLLVIICGLIRDLNKGDNEVYKIMNRFRVIYSLIDIIRSEKGELRKAALQALAALTHIEENKRTVKDLALTLCMSVIYDDENEDDVKLAAAEVINEIAIVNFFKFEIKKDKGISKLLTVIKTTDSLELKVCLCNIISSLVINDTDRLSVINDDGITILMDCVNDSNVDLLLASSTILAKASSSATGRPKMVNEGIIETAISKMNVDNHDIKVNCCTILNKVAYNEENCKNIVQTYNGVEPILDCLKLKSDELAILVISIMYKLALNCESNIQILLEKEVPEMLIRCLENGNDTVKVAAFDAIHWLSLKGVKLPAFADADIMKLVVNCLTSESTEVVRHACTTLYWLCYNDQNLIPFVVEFDILGTLIDCLDKDDVALQTISLNALNKLSYNNDVAVEVFDKGGMPKVLSLLANTNKSNQDLLIQVCNSIALFCDNAKIREYIVENIDKSVLEELSNSANMTLASSARNAIKGLSSISDAITLRKPTMDPQDLSRSTIVTAHGRYSMDCQDVNPDASMARQKKDQEETERNNSTINEADESMSNPGSFIESSAIEDTPSFIEAPPAITEEEKLPELNESAITNNDDKKSVSSESSKSSVSEPEEPKKEESVPLEAQVDEAPAPAPAESAPPAPVDEARSRSSSSSSSASETHQQQPEPPKEPEQAPEPEPEPEPAHEESLPVEEDSKADETKSQSSSSSSSSSEPKEPRPAESQPEPAPEQQPKPDDTMSQSSSSSSSSSSSA